VRANYDDGESEAESNIDIVVKQPVGTDITPRHTKEPQDDIPEVLS